MFTSLHSARLLKQEMESDEQQGYHTISEGVFKFIFMLNVRVSILNILRFSILHGSFYAPNVTTFIFSLYELFWSCGFIMIIYTVKTLII